MDSGSETREPASDKMSMELNEEENGYSDEEERKNEGFQYEMESSENSDIVMKERISNAKLPFKRKYIPFTPDDSLISIESLTVDIDGFTRVDTFNKIDIYTDGSDYYVCSKLFLVNYSKSERQLKYQIDIELIHSQLPKLHGFDSDESENEVTEIRRIGFEPIELTKQVLSEIKQDQLFKMIKQIISFVNYVSTKQHSVSLLTLDDLVSCCFLDSDFNIYFGNLSFIDIEYFRHKSLFSLGNIVYRLLGGKFKLNSDKIIDKPEFDDGFHPNWKTFVETSFVDNICLSSFYSPLMMNETRIGDKSSSAESEYESESDSYDVCENHKAFNDSKISKILEEYTKEKEFDGHKCHITFYKKNSSSESEMDRVVLKKYRFSFDSSLTRSLKIFKKYENVFLKTLIKKKESYILMEYVEAKRLKDLIPSLDYDQKITVLKKIGEKIEKLLNVNYHSVNFLNLTIDNVYIDDKFDFRYVDCIYTEDKSNDIRNAPELDHWWNKDKVDVYSLGIIAYEMFGGIFDRNNDLNYDNIPQFIENLVKICCTKDYIYRSCIFNVNEILAKYQDPDVDKLIQQELFDYSSYFIDKSDLDKMKISSFKDCYIHPSTNKLLFESKKNYDDFKSAINSYVKANQHKDSCKLVGFSHKYDSYLFYFEIKDQPVSFVRDEIFESFNERVKITALKKLVKYMNEMNEIGIITSGWKNMVSISNDESMMFIPYFVREFKASDLSFLIENVFKPDEEEYLYYTHKEPLFYQALVKINKYNKPTISQIAKAFEGMENTLSTNKDINWSKETGSIDDNDEYAINRSRSKPDLVEELIRIEILMNCSNLYSYMRKENDFALFYHGESDKQINIMLDNLENSSARRNKARKKMEGFSVDHEYNGEHCLVQFLVKGEEKLVLKKYHRHYDNIQNSMVTSCYATIWEENGELYSLQDFKDIETLEERIKRGADSLNEETKIDILKIICYNWGYFRFNPHNICITKEGNDIIIVDSICLAPDCYKDFLDNYLAPESSRFPELTLTEIIRMCTYCMGWNAYVLYGQTPEIDPITTRFKPPTFPDDFPQFWKNFITLATKENPLDRIFGNELSIIEEQPDFDEYHFVSVSSKLLNHDDYTLENPIETESLPVVYLATNKHTGEKHACKKFKFNLRSNDLKKKLLEIEKLDPSLFEINFIGVSLDGDCAYIHMGFVPNGALSEFINLDKLLKAPSWFNESAKIRIAHEIAEKMKLLHEREIIHGDLKPENIIIEENNNIKICDFSIITGKSVISSFPYRASELYEDDSVATYETDVYSYGKILSDLFGEMNEKAGIVVPPSIDSIMKKCLKINQDNRPTFSEILDELDHPKHDEEINEYKIESMDEFSGFDINIEKGNLPDGYEYEVCDITGDLAEVERLICLHIQIQTDNILNIHKYCIIGNKIVLIFENSEKDEFNHYISNDSNIGMKYLCDFISLFEIYHRNGFFFGPFSFERIFTRNICSLLCFDLFSIPGLQRPQRESDVICSPPEGINSREGDVYSFSCFALKIFKCLDVDEEGRVSTKPFNEANSPVPEQFRNELMEKCLSHDPLARPTFAILFKELFLVHLGTTKLINGGIRINYIEFKNEIGSGPFGKVTYAKDKITSQEFAVKEFNDTNSDEFTLKYMKLSGINHSNIIDVDVAVPADDSGHGVRVFMKNIENINNRSLKDNYESSFGTFIDNIFQIACAMRYLHLHGVIHLDLKPENILIRKNGSAVVTDYFNSMFINREELLKSQRNKESCASPEILNGEKFSFSTDVFSFGMLLVDIISPDDHMAIRENGDYIKIVGLTGNDDPYLLKLVKYCVKTNPKKRKSFKFITEYIYESFYQNNEKVDEASKFFAKQMFENLKLHYEERIDQLKVLALRGSREAMLEYYKYIPHEEAISYIVRGANAGIASFQNALGVFLSTEKENKSSDEMIQLAAERGDNLALTNHGFTLAQKKKTLQEAIKVLERAYSNGVVHAGYLLGLIYERKYVNGMTHSERISKAIEFYRKTANEGDAYAQWRLGVYLKYGLAEDESGYDCNHYFKKSAAQFCSKAIDEINDTLTGRELPNGKTRYLWEGEERFIFDDSGYEIRNLIAELGRKISLSNSRSYNDDE